MRGEKIDADLKLKLMNNQKRTKTTPLSLIIGVVRNA
jgi:hypothetical protein